MGKLFPVALISVFLCTQSASGLYTVVPVTSQLTVYSGRIVSLLWKKEPENYTESDQIVIDHDQVPIIEINLKYGNHSPIGNYARRYQLNLTRQDDMFDIWILTILKVSVHDAGDYSANKSPKIQLSVYGKPLKPQITAVEKANSSLMQLHCESTCLSEPPDLCGSIYTTWYCSSNPIDVCKLAHESWPRDNSSALASGPMAVDSVLNINTTGQPRVYRCQAIDDGSMLMSDLSEGFWIEGKTTNETPVETPWTTWIIISIFSPVCLLLVVAIIIWIYRRLKKRNNYRLRVHMLPHPDLITATAESNVTEVRFSNTSNWEFSASLDGYEYVNENEMERDSYIRGQETELYSSINDNFQRTAPLKL